MSSEEFDPLLFFLILGMILIVLPGIASFFTGLGIKIQRICEEDRVRAEKLKEIRRKRVFTKLRRIH